jgi:hypothetical protein
LTADAGFHIIDVSRRTKNPQSLQRRVLGVRRRLVSFLSHSPVVVTMAPFPVAAGRRSDRAPYGESSRLMCTLSAAVSRCLVRPSPSSRRGHAVEHRILSPCRPTYDVHSSVAAPGCEEKVTPRTSIVQLTTTPRPHADMIWTKSVRPIAAHRQMDMYIAVECPAWRPR